MASSVKIECPKCGWEPDGGEYWQCSSCGHVWDTFSTAARCPKCNTQHERTSCIPWRGGCTAYEPHIDWYKGLDEWVREQIESVNRLIEQPAQH